MNIFKDYPGSTLRGDKELWELLSKEFTDLKYIIEPEEFNKILDEAFQTKIKEGKKMDEDLVFFDSFKKRGMSHGYISLRWWEGHILPTLKSRYFEEYKKNIRFYMEADGRWYIDLPEYIESGAGNKENLEMLAGADDLLSELAQGETSIYLRLSDDPFEGYQMHIKRNSEYVNELEIMEALETDPGGFYHVVEKRKWYQFKKELKYVWLCPATLYLFNGEYPKDIYISKY